MSVISEEYFEMISTKIFELRQTNQYGTIKQPEHNQCKNRAALIFTLEAILDKHRESFGTTLSPLSGRKALEHLLLKKYKWPLTEIRSLSFADIVLALQEEISLDQLPEGAKQILNGYRAFTIRASFPDFMEEEWDPELYLTIPKQQTW